MEKYNLLIMGGAGYIGSHIVRLLQKSAEFQPFIFDNLMTGHIETIPEGVKFIQGDARDEELLVKTFAEYKIWGVVHLCACSLVGESVVEPLKYFDNNVRGAISLLKAMKRANVMNLVFSSTAACYGEPEKVPIQEFDVCKPINPYGQSKLMIEQMIGTLPELNSICFRYFNVAGAGMGVGEMHDNETHLIPIIIKNALNQKPVKIFGTDYPTEDGTCVRDYVHVVDLAEAHVLGMKYFMDHKAKLTINLGSQKGYSVRQVIEAAQKVIPLQAIETERRPGDPAVLIADPSNAFKILGWQATRGIDQMVQSAFEFHKDIENKLRHK